MDALCLCPTVRKLDFGNLALPRLASFVRRSLFTAQSGPLACARASVAPLVNWVPVPGALRAPVVPARLSPWATAQGAVLIRTTIVLVASTRTENSSALTSKCNVQRPCFTLLPSCVS